MDHSSGLWRQPPKDLVLQNDEVHVWRAFLDGDAAHEKKFQQTLSTDEQQRAARFRFEKDRRHFIIARRILRVILARYLDIGPDQINFHYNSHGKPGLAPTFEHEKIEFNVSHSGGLALFAMTRGRHIGVDLERIRTNFECDRIAERFFSPAERAALLALPEAVKHKAFFNCWTRKEAYIKAKGRGLSIPLDQLEVSLAPNEPAKLLHSREDYPDRSRWSLKELAVDLDYAAALAVEGDDWQLCCWSFSDNE